MKSLVAANVQSFSRPAAKGRALGRLTTAVLTATASPVRSQPAASPGADETSQYIAADVTLDSKNFVAQSHKSRSFSGQEVSQHSSAASQSSVAPFTTVAGSASQAAAVLSGSSRSQTTECEVTASATAEEQYSQGDAAIAAGLQQQQSAETRTAASAAAVSAAPPLPEEEEQQQHSAAAEAAVAETALSTKDAEGGDVVVSQGTSDVAAAMTPSQLAESVRSAGIPVVDEEAEEQHVTAAAGSDHVVASAPPSPAAAEPLAQEAKSSVVAAAAEDVVVVSNGEAVVVEAPPPPVKTPATEDQRSQGSSAEATLPKDMSLDEKDSTAANAEALRLAGYHQTKVYLTESRLEATATGSSNCATQVALSRSAEGKLNAWASTTPSLSPVAPAVRTPQVAAAAVPSPPEASQPLNRSAEPIASQTASAGAEPKALPSASSVPPSQKSAATPAASRSVQSVVGDSVVAKPASLAVASVAAASQTSVTASQTKEEAVLSSTTSKLPSAKVLSEVVPTSSSLRKRSLPKEEGTSTKSVGSEEVCTRSERRTTTSTKVASNIPSKVTSDGSSVGSSASTVTSSKRSKSTKSVKSSKSRKGGSAGPAATSKAVVVAGGVSDQAVSVKSTTCSRRHRSTRSLPSCTSSKHNATHSSRVSALLSKKVVSSRVASKKHSKAACKCGSLPRVTAIRASVHCRHQCQARLRQVRARAEVRTA